MAIDRIPGVGPQNTDIATAVAAAVPTIAAITSSITTNAASAGVTMAAITSSITTNAASAGLTNASITSAGNAAGWGATGPTTTQIAAAVPTLAQINTAITTQAAPASVTMAAITSSITTNAASAGVTLAAIGTQVANNSPSANNWTLIGSIALSGQIQTFSGLSGYKTYRLIVTRCSTNNSGIIVGTRLNADATANNYPWVFGTNPTLVNTYFQLMFAHTTAFNPPGGSSVIEISNANVAAPKRIGNSVYIQNSGTLTGSNVNEGLWHGTAAVNSISVQTLDGTSTFTQGTAYLLGAN
jgi:hypothetical protein